MACVVDETDRRLEHAGQFLCRGVRHHVQFDVDIIRSVAVDVDDFAVFDVHRVVVDDHADGDWLGRRGYVVPVVFDGPRQALESVNGRSLGDPTVNWCGGPYRCGYFEGSFGSRSSSCRSVEIAQ